MKRSTLRLFLLSIVACGALVSQATPAAAQVAVRGKIVHTMAGDPIADGVVIVTDGKISAVGSADQIAIPESYRVLQAAVVTPGLIDAHSVVGLGGMDNQDQDQEQLESSKPIQPGMRAVDAYNAKDPLVEWLRRMGITTVHTGHAPGELISGQTMIVKTVGNTVEDALITDAWGVACTLSADAQKAGTQSPGTRGKMISMLRQQLIEAREYLAKQAAAGGDASKQPSRNLRLETLARVLQGELRLIVTADRGQDIASALRLQEEFKFPLVLDSAAESYTMTEEIKTAGVPVFLHPSMYRSVGDRENMSFETAAKLKAAGIPIALQSGYENYVPKTRVALFEAAITAANGLSFRDALATITIDAATILGINDRVGSLEVGKDADLALYDGDPFEYTTHCIGVLIDGKVVSEEVR
ncbi:MAG: amidohydrolase family protein [Pirellulales bacterium]|nr:amidohydrolase family protein [Pirellulales bacterium]